MNVRMYLLWLVAYVLAGLNVNCMTFIKKLAQHVVAWVNEYSRHSLAINTILFILPHPRHVLNQLAISVSNIAIPLLSRHDTI